MKPIVINGELWRVIRVQPGDPRLVDRTGLPRLATTDYISKTIHISTAVEPPLLDRVMLHEVAHAITMSHNLLLALHTMIPEAYRIAVEEWAAQFMEGYAIETVAAASRALGRPVCVRGVCYD